MSSDESESDRQGSEFEDFASFLEDIDELGQDFASAYLDEPLADEEYMRRFNQETAERVQKEEKLKKRFENAFDLENWCKCGHCSVKLLQNPEEFLCCQELEGYIEALQSEEVQRDIAGEMTCVTDHPGFADVCLKKWCLKQAADKYKTRAGQKYDKSGKEKRSLAAVTTPVHAIQSKKLYPDTMVQVKFDGGTKLRMQIDTGADANIIDESLYHQLHPKPELRRTRQAQAVQLSTHSGKGSFQTQLTANGKQAIATVYVVPGSGPKPLIGKYTAFDLSLLSITVKELTADMQDMHHVLQERKQGNKSAKATTHVTQHMSYSAMAEHLTSKKSSKQRLDNIYKHKQDATDRVKAIVINTLGCLKRWIPFTKREQFEAILKELEDADIIEPVYGPTEWVSNVVLTPKADPSQLRMSLDVTTANTAIRRTRHVIPHWKNCDTN
eukprot:gene16075-7424_t